MRRYLKRFCSGEPTGAPQRDRFLRWGRLWVKEARHARTREGVPGQGFREGIAFHERAKHQNPTHLSKPSRGEIG